MKISGKIFLAAIAGLVLLTSCNKDDDTKPDNNSNIDVSHSFTLTEDNSFKFMVDGTEYDGTLRIINSLNNQLYLSVDLMNSSLSSVGGITLPKNEGEFLSGYDFGEGSGTNGNNVYLNMFLMVEGETYYAYSSHAYGFLEDDRIEGTECKLKIIKFTGDYTTYTWGNMTLTTFIGEVEVLFAGTFKTKDGSKTIKVEKGEIRIFYELPEGAEIIS